MLFHSEIDLPSLLEIVGYVLLRIFKNLAGVCMLTLAWLLHTEAQH